MIVYVLEKLVSHPRLPAERQPSSILLRYQRPVVDAYHVSLVRNKTLDEFNTGYLTLPRYVICVTACRARHIRVYNKLHDLAALI